MKPPRPTNRRRGIYVVHEDEITRLLRLPDDQHVIGVSTRWETHSILIMVEGDGLPEIPAGGQAPLLNQWSTFAPRPLDVAQMTPGAAHAAIIALLDGVRFEDPAGVAGRRRILERHAPVERTKHPEEPHFCGTCIERPDYSGESAADWPCVDYLDAAGDLAYGLPGQDRYLAGLAAAELATMLTDLPAPPGPTQQDAVDAARALLADPATGAKLDAMVLGDPLSLATAGPDTTPTGFITLTEPARTRRRRPPGGRPDTDQPDTD